MKTRMGLMMIFLIYQINLYAQEKSKSRGMAFDYQHLYNQSFSLHYGYMNYKINSGEKEGWLWGLEYMPSHNQLTKPIYGLKYSGFLAYKKFLNLGYGFAYYGDLKNYKVIFSPEFGLGYKSIFIVYRRNLKLIGSNLNQLNKDNISIRLYIPLNKLWFKNF